MVVTCCIEFDNNPHGIYFTGQVLCGKITLTADRAKQVKGVLLKISGFANTSWSESESHSTTSVNGRSKTETRSTHYSGHEDYIASLTYLLGSDANQSNVIAPGIHTYNFACHIPLTCPSSFEGSYGHIRYTVKVVLIRPWKFDQSYTKGFTVLKMVDLNYESPILRLPSDSEVQKTFCCGPCKSEPLKMHLTMRQSGYVPGQNIPISLLVANDTHIPIEEIKVELVMLVNYYTQSPAVRSKTERTVVTKLKGDSVPRHCNKQFTYELPVPATPPTCFHFCGILHITYEIQVEAKVKGFHANQVLCAPVTIGNVPIMGVIQQQPRSSNFATTTTTTTASEKLTGITATDEVDMTRAAPQDTQRVTPTCPWEEDANIPPPSYEVAVHMQAANINANEEHDYGTGNFSPRYPVFSLPSPSAPTDNEFQQDRFMNDGVAANKSTWL